MALDICIQKKWKGFSLDLSFVSNGSCTGILGASGCGKTITLKCIAGIEKPDAGRIAIGDKVLFDSHTKENLPPQKRRVGYLFQNYALFPNMTVEENLASGIRDKRQRKGRIEEQIKRFQLDGLEKRYPWQLSGGQQQRVAMGRILAGEPKILLLDEPFSALDSYLKDTLQREMLKIIADFNGEVIMVSHSRDEIYKFSDCLAVMGRGELLTFGRTKEIFKNPKKMEAARLTGCKNISPIQKISERELYAIAWGMKLNTCEEIKDRIQYVGIRAHSLLPAQREEGENIIAVRYKEVSEAPFEIQYMLENKNHSGGKELWWKQGKEELGFSKTKKRPEYFSLPASSLMLLE